MNGKHTIFEVGLSIETPKSISAQIDYSLTQMITKVAVKEEASIVNVPLWLDQLNSNTSILSKKYKNHRFVAKSLLSHIEYILETGIDEGKKLIVWSEIHKEGYPPNVIQFFQYSRGTTVRSNDFCIPTFQTIPLTTNPVHWELPKVPSVIVEFFKRIAAVDYQLQRELHEKEFQLAQESKWQIVQPTFGKYEIIFPSRNESVQRLYAAMQSGSIPIIIGKIVLPYDFIIDYKSQLLFVPVHEISNLAAMIASFEQKNGKIGIDRLIETNKNIYQNFLSKEGFWFNFHYHLS